MADLVGQIQRDIEKRLQELRPLIEEKEQLEAVLAALTNGTAGGRAPAPVRARATTTRAVGRAPYAAGKGRRAPRGANREAILAVVRERPGVSASEVAAITRIAKPTVHTTISQLKRKGILEP
ncbi:MAG TPA: helix-turn-helix domain-containing protein, partial [Conexibacter sp.]|nr:helix-turn-helix domain-containing protein [Conexibacter sp.]